ncbi:MAG: alpha/beta hydrolase family protein, partial [Minisyncoccota bacterium]
TDLTVLNPVPQFQSMIDNFVRGIYTNREASPITYVNRAGNTKFLLLHAINDEMVPFPIHGTPFYEKLFGWAPSSVQKKWYTTGGHGFFARNAPDYPDIIRTISMFLRGVQTSTPAPTAALTINGVTNGTFNVGDTVTFAWNSTNATSWNSTYTATGCTNTTLNGTFPWSANSQSGGTTGIIDVSMAGCSYTMTYYATGPGGSTSASVRGNVRAL